MQNLAETTLAELRARPPVERGAHGAYDVVVTWCCMDDAHTRAIAAYRQEGSQLCENGANRFTDHGELRAAIRAYLVNFRDLGSVVVVHADYQQPDLDEFRGLPVRTCAHAEFIPTTHLPTFNSHVIELYLDRIPGISDTFLAANDDFVMLKPTSASDVLDSLGRPRFLVQGGMELGTSAVECQRRARRGMALPSAHNMGWRNAVDLLPLLTKKAPTRFKVPYRYPCHAPVVVHRESFGALRTLAAASLGLGSMGRFREHTDIYFIGLYIAYSVETQCGSLKTASMDDYQYVGLKTHTNFGALANGLVRRRPRFLCLNDESLPVPKHADLAQLLLCLCPWTFERAA